MRLFLALVLLLACGQANAANLSHIKGVAGAGWLHLEDWMFSWPMDQGLPPVDYDYSLVDTQRGRESGPFATCCTAECTFARLTSR